MTDQFNLADVAIGTIIILSAVIGLMRGLVRELLSVIVWVVAFVLALAYAPLVAPSLSGVAADPMVRQVIAMLIVFVGALIAGALVQWLVQRLIQSTGLTGTDRLLGFLFGALRGGLVCVIGLVALRPFAAGYDWWQGSMLVTPLIAFETDVLALVDVVTTTVRDLINRGS